MSKCDLQIVFDQPGRTYRPGDTVSGTVVVLARDDVQCDGLILTTRWETHGAGNRDSGTEQRWNLYQGQWQAGQRYEYAFSFTAPAGPPTYHGHYLNVDQYVKVQADVPWAFDPKAAEEYILLPGPPEYAAQPAPTAAKAASTGNVVVSAIVGVVMIVVGVIFFCPMFVLIPIGLIVLAWSARKAIAEWKTGQVHLAIGSPYVVPGEAIPLRLQFTPGGNLPLQGIRATLRAREECVRGSGTNKKTSRHTLHEATTILAEEGVLPGGQPAQFGANIVVPDLGLYSFAASDNKLIWELELVLDIPSWPDWKETRLLCVRPAGAEPGPRTTAEPEGSQPLLASLVEPIAPPSADWVEPLEQAEPVRRSEPEWLEPADVIQPVEPPAESIPPSEPEVAGLAPLFESLAATGRYSSERQAIVDRASSQSHEIDVAVERVERTYAFDVPEALRNGRTVIGTLAGTEHKVAVQAAAASNDVMDDLQAGQTLRTRAFPAKWNIVHDRLELREET